jgi:hypothetical protein
MAVSVAIVRPVRLSAGTQPRVNTGTYLHVDLTTQVPPIADVRWVLQGGVLRVWRRVTEQSMPSRPSMRSCAHIGRSVRR